MNLNPGLSLFEKGLTARIEPALEKDGQPRQVNVRQETLIVLGEILHEIRRLNSPWLAPKEIAAYLGVHPSMVTKWKEAKLLKPHYVHGLENPRYLRTEVDALVDRPPGIIRISRKA